MTLKLEPNAEEKREMAGLLDARAARAKLASAVVSGLAEGKLPSAEALQSFRATPTTAL
jgi:hypothetical protein